MRFTKMQGAGNDFVVIDNRDGSIAPERYPQLARKLCARRISVGADGLMALEKPRNGGDIGMAFYNSDGTLGEMCGNGARCAARYAFDHGAANGEELKIETVSGTVTARREEGGMFTVRLNSPTVIREDVKVHVLGSSYDCSYIELGRPGLPQAICHYADWDAIPEEELREIGRAIRNYSKFPKGANVTFVKLIGKNHVKAKTFERGVEDFTLACGTGSGSAGLALYLRNKVSGDRINISVPGGELYVTVRSGDGSFDIYLTGPAVTVCEGDTVDAEVTD